MFPVDKIFSAGMPPMHRSPIWTIWMVLIENMVIPLEIYQTIGIIHPVCLGHEMILETISIIYFWYRLADTGICFLQQGLIGWLLVIPHHTFSYVIYSAAVLSLNRALHNPFKDMLL